jgi:hypothetical protein
MILISTPESVKAFFISQSNYSSSYSTTTPNAENGFNLIQYLGQSPASGTTTAIRLKSTCDTSTNVSVNLYKSSSGVFYTDSTSTASVIGGGGFVDIPVSWHINVNDYLWVQFIESYPRPPEFTCSIGGMNDPFATVPSQGNMSGIAWADTYTQSANRPGVTLFDVTRIYYLLAVDQDLPVIDNPNVTSITSVIPGNNETIATSTTNTIGANGFLASEDLNDYSKLKIHIASLGDQFVYGQCADVICATLGFKRDFSYSLVTATGFNFASSTAGLPLGRYSLRATIEKGSFCVFGFCASTKELVATTTTFLVATTTRNDQLRERTLGFIDTYNSMASTTTDFSACTIGAFNLLICGQDLLTWAFVPTSDSMSYTVETIKTGVLRKVPFGYVYRFVEILTDTASTTLPTFDIPLLYPNSNNQMAFATSTLFQPGDMLAGAGQVLDSIKDPIWGTGLKDTFEPIIKAIIAMLVLVTIVSDLLGMHRHSQESKTT